MFPKNWTKVAYSGWKDCYRLATEKFELIVTADVGPRIVKFALPSRENILREFPEQIGTSGALTWQIYGGHRLWHSPEDPVRTYFPDNAPVEVVAGESALTFRAPVESSNGTRKEITIGLSPDEKSVLVEHSIQNTSAWPITLAPWALTVMKEGGTAFIPLPPKVPHSNTTLKPGWNLSCWSYTDLSDSRYSWSEKFLKVRQCGEAKNAQKIGIQTGINWAAYQAENCIFIKTILPDGNANPNYPFPDKDVQWEVFTNFEMLEVETLGRLTELQPGDAVRHGESWRIIGTSSEITDDEEMIRICLE